MALSDIQEKKAEERKREKRLVPFINGVSKDFQNTKLFKKKTAMFKENADYVVKSFLDYLFFNEHKEIRELNDNLVHHFMLDYAPRKLAFSATSAKHVPQILSELLIFLETEGHIKNGAELSTIAKENSSSFLKLSSKQKTIKQAKVSKTANKLIAETKVGRNDPCPCGSGKKYKKCCGRPK
jgi:uncharacterized protein YecA (UPF0149 family)